MLGTRIKQTLIHGAEKDEIKSLVRQAVWFKRPEARMGIIRAASMANVLPQAMAAHILIIFGDERAKQFIFSDLGNTYRSLLGQLGDRQWKDRLQASLFAIGAYEVGVPNIRAAMNAAHRYDESLGVSNRNYRNWMYVQDFLWGVMKPPEKCRPLRKLMFTVIEVMCMIADEFPDDLSPKQALIS
jgi:hypothetical protein